MPSDLEQLQTIRTQLLGLIAQITASPKPTYAIDDQSVSWNEYLGRLQAAVDWCDRRAAAYDPVEIQSQGIT